MDLLRNRLERQFRDTRNELSKLVREHGELVISSVSLAQVLGGMRGVQALVCDTSSVDPEEGLSIRGLHISKLQDRSPEEIFWLLLTGFLPEERELQRLREHLHGRRRLPAHVPALLRAMPADSHPMTMFNAGVLAMQGESRFSRAYAVTPKDELWVPALEDALDLFARLPLLAAAVLRQRYGLPQTPDPEEQDWTRDFALRLLGRDDPDFESLLRRYVVVQSDHENGNVCAFAGHITGSAHADLYRAISSGLNGLAGRIHGLAAQDFMNFLLELQEQFAGPVGSKELRSLLRERLAQGRVIPGFGHAVLRQQDPRFEILRELALERYGSQPLMQLAEQVYKAGTQVLVERGGVKNPYPNVDAITGVVLSLSGISQLEYYTVLFGVSLSIGMLAQNVISRGLGWPLVRPRSVSLAELQRMTVQCAGQC